MRINNLHLYYTDKIHESIILLKIHAHIAIILIKCIHTSLQPSFYLIIKTNTLIVCTLVPIWLVNVSVLLE